MIAPDTRIHPFRGERMNSGEGEIKTQSLEEFRVKYVGFNKTLIRYRTADKKTGQT